MEILQVMEAATVQSKKFTTTRGSQRTSPPVLTVAAPVAAKSLCGRCGRGNHDKNDCKLKSAKCHKCGKVGHIAPVCRSKASGRRHSGPTKKTKWVSTTPAVSNEDSSEENNYLYVIQSKSSPPYREELHVSGHKLAVEVDMGAAVSLAPESAVASLISTAKLQPSNVILKTYTGEQIPVKGTLSVDVKYGQQHHKNLKLLVVAGSGPTLIVRDWLKFVRLDWRKIGKVSVVSADLENHVNLLLDQY